MDERQSCDMIDLRSERQTAQANLIRILKSLKGALAEYLSYDYTLIEKSFYEEAKPDDSVQRNDMEEQCDEERKIKEWAAQPPLDMVHVQHSEEHEHQTAERITSYDSERWAGGFVW